MKIQTYFISLISILILSCQNDRLQLNPTDTLKKMSKIKTQIFNLDTISLTTVKGKNGTVIFYDRQKINISNDAKITLNLSEYFEFEDLILNNIQTITKDNKLLESSGVIKIEFFADGKPIQLKKGMYLEINIPSDKLRGNILFSGEIDSLGNMEWDEIKNEPIVEETNFLVVKRGVNKIYKEKDTVNWTYPYDNLSENSDNDSIETKLDKTSKYLIYNYNWINCDRYIDDYELKTIKISLTDVSHKMAQVYILYHGQNSFSSHFFYYEKTIEIPIQYLPRHLQ